MKIRKRQNRLYEIFNGKNRIRYIVISVVYIYLFVIFFLYYILYPWFFELRDTSILLSCIFLIRIFLKKFFNRFYYPRFNPSTYYKFVQEKYNPDKRKTKDIKLNKAIIATRKYIDRHYNHIYDADTLLLRLKKMQSSYYILTQLPSNYLIGIITGLVSSFLTSIMLSGENQLSFIVSIVLCILMILFTIIVLYYSIKSFYSEYDSIIIPYEISKIKERLSDIDDIYSNC